MSYADLLIAGIEEKFASMPAEHEPEVIDMAKAFRIWTELQNSIGTRSDATDEDKQKIVEAHRRWTELRDKAKK